MNGSQQETSRRRAADQSATHRHLVQLSVVSGEINEPSPGQWGHLYVAYAA
jgi:hypothetical protein